MIVETQDSGYFHRMANSLGDKARIIPFLVPGSVLDIGSGGGELAETIRSNGHDVWANDASPVAIERIQSHYPKLNTSTSFAQDLGEEFPNGSFHNVTASSILHEVFSYGAPQRPSSARSESEVLKVMQTAYHLLTPGGRFIVRDGVLPNNYDEQMLVVLKTKEAKEFLLHYAEQAPFWGKRNAPHKVNLRQVDDHAYQGDRASVMEFIFTLTWGMESINRESQELYGVFDFNDYQGHLGAMGFNVIHAEKYLQPDYVKHLQPHVELWDLNGALSEWPCSNMLLVAEKPY